MVTTTPKKQAPRNYVNNEDFLIEIRKSRAQGRMTDKLGRMMMLLVDRYAKKSSFSGYSYLSDMKSSALLNLCKCWAGFDETKSNNPFGYYSISVLRSFIQVLNSEKKHRDGRDKLLVEFGMSPSHSYEWDLAHVDGLSDHELGLVDNKTTAFNEWGGMDDLDGISDLDDMDEDAYETDISVDLSNIIEQPHDD